MLNTENHNISEKIKKNCKFRNSVLEDYFVNNCDKFDKDTFLGRVRLMAIEVIESFISDILTVDKIRELNITSNDSELTSQKRNFARMMLNRHINSVRWFCDGTAVKSMWFEALDMSDTSQRLLIDLVHKRIEGEI